MVKLRRRLIAGLVFGFLVVLGLILLSDLRKVGDELAGFRWGLTPLILLCTLFNYLLRYMKWNFYLSRIGVRGLSMLGSARIFVAGFPLAVTPAKVGEALKAAWLHQASSAPIARGVTVVLAERISDGLAVLVLSTLGVVAYPRYWPVFAIVLAGLLAIVVLSQFRSLATHLLDLAGRLPLVGRLGNAMHEFYESAYALFRPKSTFIAVSLGTLAWLGEGVGMYLVLLGLGVPPGVETLSLAVFVLSFSIVVGAISALPGGLLAAEGSIAAMLVLTLGLSASVAAAATLLIRFATLWFGVSLGLMTWAFSGRMLTLEPGAEQR